MKKMMLIMFLAIGTLAIFSQSLEELFDKYSDDSRFEYVSIGKAMMGMLDNFTDLNTLDGGAMSKMDGLKILTLDDEWNSKLASSVVSEFNKVVKAEKLETLVEVRDSDERVRMLLRKNKDNNDLVIITEEEDELSIIWISGRLSMDEIMQMVEDII